MYASSGGRPRFDTRPLGLPVSSAQARHYAEQLRVAGMLPVAHTVDGAVTAVVALTVGIVLGVGLAGYFAFALVVSVVRREGFSSALGNLLVFLALSTIVIVIVVATWRRREGAPRRWLSLARFAAANGLVYIPGIRAHRLPGRLYRPAWDAEALDVMRIPAPRPVELGTYRFRPTDMDPGVESWGYLAVSLAGPGAATVHPALVAEVAASPFRFGAEQVGAVLMLTTRARFDVADPALWQNIAVLLQRIEPYLARPATSPHTPRR